MIQLRRLEVEERSPEWNQIQYELQFRTGKPSIKIINLYKYNTAPIDSPFQHLTPSFAIVDVSEFKKQYKRDLMAKVLPLSDVVFNCGLLEAQDYQKQPTRILNVLIGKVALGTIGTLDHSILEADSVLVEEGDANVPYQFNFQVKHYEQYQIQYQVSFVVEDESDILMGDPLCALCDNRLAQFYCREDNRYFCQPCGVQHQRDTSIGPKEKKAVSHSLQALNRLNTVPNCDQHSQKYEHYCLNCEKYLCGLCLQKGPHAQNSDHVVRNIQYHYRQGREETEAVSTALQRRIGDILQTVEEREKEINQNYDQIRAHLKKEFDYALEELDRLYKQRIIRVVSDEIELRRMQEQVAWGKFFIKHLEQTIRPLMFFRVQSRCLKELKEMKVSGYESAFTTKADLDSEVFVKVGTQEEMTNVRQKSHSTLYKYTEKIEKESGQGKKNSQKNSEYRREASLLTYNQQSETPPRGKLVMLLENSSLHFFKSKFCSIQFDVRQTIRGSTMHYDENYIVMLIRTKLKHLKIIANIANTTTRLISKPQMASFSRMPIMTLCNTFGHVPISSKYHHTQLPTTVAPLLQLLTRQKNFDQKIVILEHLTQTILADPRLMLTLDQQNIIHKQIQLWRGRKGRFQKVATVAWVIKKLNLLQRHKELFQQIAQRVAEDEWYVNFDESLKALQAFTILEDSKLADYIYPRIERNVKITVWEINMIYYQRLTMALLEARRTESDLWEKLENHILTNLGMDYSLKAITDIFTAYAMAGKGSDIFFQQLQKAIYLGHWDNRSINHKLLPGYEQRGEFYALLVQTYCLVKQQSHIYLMPDFLQYIYNGLTHRKTQYARLQSFTTIVTYLPGILQDEDAVDVITDLLKNKKPTNIVSTEIVSFFDTMAARGVTVPDKLHRHIEQQLLSDIRNNFIPASKALELAEELILKGYGLESRAFQEAVSELIGRRFRYLEGEEAKAALFLVERSEFLTAEHKQELLALPYRPSIQQ